MIEQLFMCLSVIIYFLNVPSLFPIIIEVFFFLISELQELFIYHI